MGGSAARHHARADVSQVRGRNDGSEPTQGGGPCAFAVAIQRWARRTASAWVPPFRSGRCHRTVRGHVGDQLAAFGTGRGGSPHFHLPLLRSAAGTIGSMDLDERLMMAADKLTGVDLQWLGARTADEVGPHERGESLRQAALLAGCLWHASVVLIDGLFDDVEQMRSQQDSDWAAAVDDTEVLATLPVRFRPHYSPVFTQKFLVAAVAVTERLAKGWAPLACVAEELAVRCLLNQVEVIAETFEVALRPDWRSELEEYLFEDLDHEFLFDQALDGFEDDATFGPPGMAPMDFASWFVPFNDERRLPPYAEDDPAGV